MYTLFISTFNKYIYVGVLKDNTLLKMIKKESVKNHSVYTVPIIKDLLEELKIDLKELNQIEVINGPGSFTGVRIGVTIAKTLAYTLNIKIKSITSLEAYAVSNETSDKKVITIKDVKGVFFGIFDKNNELTKPLNYLNKDEFNEYIKTNKLDKYLIKDLKDLNIELIHEYLKNKKSTNPHKVNPLYIKQIEVEK